MNGLLPMKFAGMPVMDVSHSADLIALLIYPLLRTERNETYSFSFKRAPFFLPIAVGKDVGSPQLRKQLGHRLNGMWGRQTGGWEEWVMDWEKGQILFPLEGVFYNTPNRQSCGDGAPGYQGGVWRVCGAQPPEQETSEPWLSCPPNALPTSLCCNLSPTLNPLM